MGPPAPQGAPVPTGDLAPGPSCVRVHDEPAPAPVVRTPHRADRSPERVVLDAAHDQEPNAAVGLEVAGRGCLGHGERRGGREPDGGNPDRHAAPSWSSGRSRTISAGPARDIRPWT